MSYTQEQVEHRIQTLMHCRKPKGWHYGNRLNSAIPQIMILIELKGASFADVAFYLTRTMKTKISRQSVHRFYRRITKLAERNTLQRHLMTAVSIGNESRKLGDELRSIKLRRHKRHWSYRSPLRNFTALIHQLLNIEFLSYANVADSIQSEVGRLYSRQAIFDFMRRCRATVPLPEQQFGYWGEPGKT